MARLPRIDLAGFHHVINRGVERRKVFVDKEDYNLQLPYSLWEQILYYTKNPFKTT